jgi:hypothetical protein
VKDKANSVVAELLAISGRLQVHTRVVQQRIGHQ